MSRGWELGKETQQQLDAGARGLEGTCLSFLPTLHSAQVPASPLAARICFLRTFSVSEPMHTLHSRCWVEYSY